MARAIDMAVEKAMPLSRDVDLGMVIEIAIAMGMAMFFCLGYGLGIWQELS